MMMKLRDIKLSDEMRELRPVDAFTVSRYRQAMRMGVVFPPLILDKADTTIVSGNHRFDAYMAEYPDDYDVEVELRKFACRADKLILMAQENSSHGMPMDGITRRRVALELAKEGVSPADIARLFNVPERTLEKWGERYVVVIGKGRGHGGQMKPIKTGLEVEPGTKVETAVYTEHMKQDMGVNVRMMAGQIVRWIENGWINMEDERNVEALTALKVAVNRIV